MVKNEPAEEEAVVQKLVESGQKVSKGGDTGKSVHLIQSIFSSLFGKLASLAAPLLTIPATLEYLGAERYGMWVAVTSLTSMAVFADLGIGNGLLTRLAQSSARNDECESRRIVSSAYFLLTAVGVFLLAAVSVASWLVDWSTILNVADPELTHEAPMIVLVCFSAFALNVPLSLIQKVQYAQQQIGQSNAWLFGSAAFSVALVMWGVQQEMPPLAIIALAAFSLPLSNLFNTVVYFGIQNRVISPVPRAVSRTSARAMANIGGKFFIISVLMAASLNSDTFLIANLLGAAAAGEYSIIAKLFATLSLFVTMVGLVLWPANSAALAAGNIRWVRRVTRRASFLSAGIIVACGIPLVLWSNPVILAWTHDADIKPASTVLLVALLAWSVVLAFASPLFMVQNSVGQLGSQIAGWAIFLPVSLLFKVVAAKAFGAAGVSIAGTITYVIFVLPFAFRGYRSALRITTPTSNEIRRSAGSRYAQTNQKD